MTINPNLGAGSLTLPAGSQFKLPEGIKLDFSGTEWTLAAGTNIHLTYGGHSSPSEGGYHSISHSLSTGSIIVLNSPATLHQLLSNNVEWPSPSDALYTTPQSAILDINAATIHNSYQPNPGYPPFYPPFPHHHHHHNLHPSFPHYSPGMSPIFPGATRHQG